MKQIINLHLDIYIRYLFLLKFLIFNFKQKTNYYLKYFSPNSSIKFSKKKFQRREFRDEFLTGIHPFHFAGWANEKWKRIACIRALGRRRVNHLGLFTTTTNSTRLGAMFWPRQFSNKSRGSFQNFRIFDIVCHRGRKEKFHSFPYFILLSW